MRLAEIDWDSEWKQAQTGRSVAYSSEFWDKKAPSFRSQGVTDYERDFLTYACIEKDWTVLDVGAGSGTFTLPLALEGHEVTAIDFSPGMLTHLNAEAKLENVEDRITTIQGSWDDDWQTLGIEPESVDVVIASRSFLTFELCAALKKLNDTARKRVCLTIGVASFPFYDVKLMQEIGRSLPVAGDYFILLGALAEMGILAEVRLIGSLRRDVYLDRAGAKEAVLHSLGSVTAEEEVHLERYFDEHIIPWKLTTKEYEKLTKEQTYKDLRIAGQARADSSDAVHEGVAKDYLRDTRWAFISWDKE